MPLAVMFRLPCSPNPPSYIMNSGAVLPTGALTLAKMQNGFIKKLLASIPLFVPKSNGAAGAWKLDRIAVSAVSNADPLAQAGVGVGVMNMFVLAECQLCTRSAKGKRGGGGGGIFNTHYTSIRTIPYLERDRFESWLKETGTAAGPRAARVT